ncbi:MAG TPA: chemotaxis protein CheW [Stenotrophobium sp.]|jgi:purine-binding chemotaxis protein CheW|nr:chemotaxis protein CheW [Stenotrophobium sp.]
MSGEPATVSRSIAGARRQGDVLTRWVSFDLCGQPYGIAIMKVMEVLATAAIEPVPGAPPAVLGVINLRGSIVTVVDLRQKLGLPAAADGACLIIVAHEGQPVGLRVDHVAEVLNLAEQAIKPAPATSAGKRQDAVAGIVSRQGRLLTLIDPSSLLAGD